MAPARSSINFRCQSGAGGRARTAGQARGADAGRRNCGRRSSPAEVRVAPWIRHRQGVAHPPDPEIPASHREDVVAGMPVLKGEIKGFLNPGLNASTEGHQVCGGLESKGCAVNRSGAASLHQAVVDGHAELSSLCDGISTPRWCEKMCGVSHFFPLPPGPACQSRSFLVVCRVGRTKRCDPATARDQVRQKPKIQRKTCESAHSTFRGGDTDFRKACSYPCNPTPILSGGRRREATAPS